LQLMSISNGSDGLYIKFTLAFRYQGCFISNNLDFRYWSNLFELVGYHSNFQGMWLAVG